MIKKEEVYHIGRLGKPHGVKGEISFAFTTDVWDHVDAEYLVLLIDGIFVPFFMEEYRFRGSESALLKFCHIDSLDDVRQLTGTEVYFPYSLTPEDEDADYTWAVFEGYRIVDAEQGELGTIVRVDDSTVNVLFEVETPAGTVLIPAVEAFIQDIDHDKRIVRMQLPEGLLEIGN